MHYVELDVDGIKRVSRDLCRRVAEDFRPDAVAYVARGGYFIGCEAAAYFGVPVIELETQRTEAFRKRSSMLQRLPRWSKHLARAGELELRRLAWRQSGPVERPLRASERTPWPDELSRILIVDDSIDSGASVRAARRVLATRYPQAVIRVAVLNTFQPPSKGGVGNCDWTLMERSLLSTPSSKDNRDYEAFCRAFEQGDALRSQSS